MEFYLARELGMTRAELLERMSGNEFVHWVAFVMIERHDQEQAQKKAKNRAAAAQMSRRLNATGG